jgi:ribosome biogenesis SPOUT family RNA methylase Rps3
MRNLASPDSQLHFTHLSKSSCDCLADAFKTADADSQLLASVFCHRGGVMDLIDQQLLDVTIDQVCLLDPKAETALSPQDGDGRFMCFLFGVSGFSTVSFFL